MQNLEYNLKGTGGVLPCFTTSLDTLHWDIRLDGNSKRMHMQNHYIKPVNHCTGLDHAPIGLMWDISRILMPS